MLFVNHKIKLKDRIRDDSRNNDGPIKIFRTVLKSEIFHP